MSSWSDWAREQLKDAIKRHITACYDPRDDGGIPISFLIEGDDGAPSIDEFNFGPRTDAGFSVLPIGGWDPKGDDVWGRCPYDANNQRNEDVSQTPELGVMAGQIASAILTSNMNVGYPSELVPQVGGLAFGGDFADGIVLGPTFDVGDPFLPDRVEAVLYAIELVAAFTALRGTYASIAWMPACRLGSMSSPPSSGSPAGGCGKGAGGRVGSWWP